MQWVTVMNKLAFGCSHTYGIGVEPTEAWPSLLDAINLGVPGCSIDLIARILPSMLDKYTPHIVYILWPDWTRFEYIEHGIYKQSLPMDSNRIYFMEKATDEWLQNNYLEQVEKIRKSCCEIELIDITLYDLIPFIDHADKWPISKLGHHYNHEWHQWVANIFRDKAQWITNHRHFV